MAGPSSKASYMNIETAETSIDSKFGYIEVGEATGDSGDEDCCLERKKCDVLMEHLKANPGLVVKSLDPKGRIVLHVAVMAGETKKTKPSGSKQIVKGLREAAHDSDWYHAMRVRDCKALMSLLQENPCLVAQTGPEGWTVLHAAAYRGCLQLLDQVHDLFKNESRPLYKQFVDNMSGVEVDWDDLCRAKCGKYEAETHHMAWFTCPREVLRNLIPKDIFLPAFLSSTQRPSSDVFQHLKDKVLEIMQGESTKKAFRMIPVNIFRDRDFDIEYNFVLDSCKELQFHYACGHLLYGIANPARDYVKTIIDGCLNLEPSGHESVDVLEYLLKLHNAQGQTPLHVASTRWGMDKLLELLPEGDAYKECLNARDVRGWTALHLVAARKDHEALEVLLKDERIDANSRTTTNDVFDLLEAGLTTLHLAILHNDVESVELLLKCPRTDVNVILYREITCGYERQRRGEDSFRSLFWSPLQLAAIMGLSDVVRALLGSKKFSEIYDDGKLQNHGNVDKKYRRVSAILLASASGNPDTLRLFLDNPIFDPLVKFEGATTLHYATNAMMPTMCDSYFFNYKAGRFLCITDLSRLDENTCRYKEELKDTKLTLASYHGRQACITMLLQAGVDIWEKDNQHRLAEPGPQAPEEAILWWHQQMARETMEAKKSLNDAANAIAVVAALVATASFVGPLQPPLGYGGDSMEGGVQDTHLSIRVFMVSNILSFYLAIASILFAVVPSLPMPQEGIYTEWQRTRKTVSVAIFFLLMSVLGVLISFGAASNSVVSKDYSWQHGGLSFYPTLLGGFICLLGIILFFLRLLRLVFNRNATIRYLYKTFVKF